MKRTILAIGLLFLLGPIPNTNAQVWKKIKKESERRVDKVLTGKRKKNNKETKDSEGSSSKSEIKNDPVHSQKNPVTVWRNYKFIPGEKVIFSDDLSIEEVGEFPSRWDLRAGGAEVATFNGEKVIIGMAKHENLIYPLFENENYLGDEFTIEFDVYVDELSLENNNSWVDYNIILSKKSLESRSRSVGNIEFGLRKDKVRGYVLKYEFQLEQAAIGALHAWHHVAISYHKGKFKMYFDEKRIANIPRLNLVPDVFAIDLNAKSNENYLGRKLNYGIRNIRIAHGGGQLYKRIVADGKYITNGILFDSGNAKLKPQSMGVINKIASVMQENKDWQFEIEGHTDSEGDDDYNLQLSNDRAIAVKKALESYGIEASRLTTSGKGESDPLNSNTTAEERANNRRVVFILKK